MHATKEHRRATENISATEYQGVKKRNTKPRLLQLEPKKNLKSAKQKRRKEPQERTTKEKKNNPRKRKKKWKRKRTILLFHSFAKRAWPSLFTPQLHTHHKEIARNQTREERKGKTNPSNLKKESKPSNFSNRALVASTATTRQPLPMQDQLSSPRTSSNLQKPGLCNLLLHHVSPTDTYIAHCKVPLPTNNSNDGDQNQERYFFSLMRTEIRKTGDFRVDL